MKTLEDFMKRYAFLMDNMSFIFENGEISHLTWENDDILYNVTAPHKGNDYKYILRVNPKKTFDKWGNADIEEFYDTLEDLNHELFYKDWIEKTLLNIYIDRYLEDLED